MRKFLWGVVFLSSLAATPGRAQVAPVVETDSAMSVAYNSPSVLTATYSDGSYIRIAMNVGGKTANVQLRLASETQITYVNNLPVVYSAQWLDKGMTILASTIGDFTATTQSGTEVNVSNIAWVADRKGNSGRGGGNYYVLATGTEQISF